MGSIFVNTVNCLVDTTGFFGAMFIGGCMIGAIIVMIAVSHFFIWKLLIEAFLNLLK